MKSKASHRCSPLIYQDNGRCVPCCQRHALDIAGGRSLEAGEARQGLLGLKGPEPEQEFPRCMGPGPSSPGSTCPWATGECKQLQQLTFAHHKANICPLQLSSPVHCNLSQPHNVTPKVMRIYLLLLCVTTNFFDGGTKAVEGNVSFHPNLQSKIDFAVAHQEGGFFSLESFNIHHFQCYCIYNVETFPPPPHFAPRYTLVYC